MLNHVVKESRSTGSAIMVDDDQIFSRCFEMGRRAARIGLPIAANPYLDTTSAELPAWVEGYASVDAATMPISERAAIYAAGNLAARNGEAASICPFVDEDNPERMEIWLIGYAPAIEPELAESAPLMS